MCVTKIITLPRIATAETLNTNPVVMARRLKWNLQDDTRYFLLSLAQVSFKVTVLLNTSFPGEEWLSGVK